MRNRGFCGGMKIVGGAKYDLKFYARGVDGYAGGLRVVLEKPSVEKGGAIVQLAEFKVRPGQMKVGEAGATPFDRILPDWTKFTAELVAAEDATNATLSVLLDSKGIVDVEFVSLFPRDTYRHEPNGLRADLVEKLAALRPGIIRFPGGCIAEGDDFMSWYDWKRSVGPVERRYLNENRWDSERSARRLVYWQTQGLGYFEYFRLCEDLGAEPLPICLAGLTCQYRRPTHYAPMESLDYFVTNIVDLIEFATGDPSKNPWAKIRADMGHPAPFRLKYVGIGNENWDQPFFDRYSVVASAVARLHPEITIVSSSGPNVDEGRWERAWKFLREQNAGLFTS
jgi:alpha-L-arabinofuranosidase